MQEMKRCPSLSVAAYHPPRIVSCGRRLAVKAVEGSPIRALFSAVIGPKYVRRPYQSMEKALYVSSALGSPHQLFPSGFVQLNNEEKNVPP